MRTKHRAFISRHISQRGQVILASLLLLMLFVAMGVYSRIRPENAILVNAAKDELALAQAKDALINYATGRPATNRPGELPCPDLDDNGIADGPCNIPTTQIGRLPWRTLQIPDLRDGSGERLWYAVSNNFKNSTAVVPLNSNTLGELTVIGTTPAVNVVAIVFAAGSVVAGQSRTVANNNNVTHYLEGENANGDIIYITGEASATFNDRLLAITPAMFFPPLETRVAQQLRSTLNQYYALNGYFPSANDFGSGLSCVANNQGLLPPDPSTCGSFASWSPPAWYTANDWYRIIFYAVAPACVNPAMPHCTSAGGFLNVNSVSGVHAILITPGPAYVGQARPCATRNDCLETPNASSYPTFTHITGSSTINDRVVIVAP